MYSEDHSKQQDFSEVLKQYLERNKLTFLPTPPAKYSKEIKLYSGDGYCRFVDSMGDDLTPVRAARMSTLNPTGVDTKKDDALRDYLWRLNHVSPFEQAEISFEIQVPMFVANQLVRHRTIQLNAFSLRYSEPMHKYYVPEPDYVCFDDKYNKQASGAAAPDEIIQEFIESSKKANEEAQTRYDHFRELGLAKERVRDSQPVSAYTRLVVKANLRNWFHFLNLRLKPGAQREIRDLANAIYSIIKDLFPKCCEVFEEHTLNAVTFSKGEHDIMQMIVRKGLEAMMDKGFGTLDDILSSRGITGSKARELKQKLTE